MKKKTIGAIILGVLFIGGCVSMSEDSEKVTTNTTTTKMTVDESIEWIQEHKDEVNAIVNSYTLSQQNAIKKAESYLNFMGFSKQGLIDQLEYEGFSIEDATFAVDNIIVDWNEQAAKKAQSYLDTMSFSRQGLIDQLEYEGFTSSEIEYGIAAVGY